MTRSKHGNYNQTTHLPDNRGQAQESGLYVWLLEQIRLRLPEAEPLIEQCYEHGAKKYTWLIEQLATLDTAESAALTNEFNEKRRYLEAEKRQRYRYQSVALLKEQFDENPDRTWLPQRIERVEREIAKAQERWKFGGQNG